MKKVKDKLKIAELRGVGKILNDLWIDSYYAMGEKASKRIEEEMIYYFGNNWSTDMYDFIEEGNSGHLIEPVITLEECESEFNKGHQPKDEEYPPLADNSKIGL